MESRSCPHSLVVAEITLRGAAWREAYRGLKAPDSYHEEDEFLFDAHGYPMKWAQNAWVGCTVSGCRKNKPPTRVNY